MRGINLVRDNHTLSEWGVFLNREEPMGDELQTISDLLTTELLCVDDGGYVTEIIIPHQFKYKLNKIEEAIERAWEKS